MTDLTLIVLAIGFFAGSIAYVNACERLRRGSHD
jgi:hypothetical protein